MNQLLYTLLFIFSLSVAKGQSCYPNGITFNSFQQIRDFAQNNPDCTEIGGDVVFRGIQINDTLIGLENIKVIKGNVTFFFVDKAENLIGLSNLERIEGVLTLSYTSDLVNLEGLNNLVYLGGLIIDECEQLETFSGLDKLVNVGGLFSVSGRYNFKSFTGLESLKTIGGVLSIANSRYMVHLDGLESLRKVGGLYLNRNKVFTDFSALANLDTIVGDLTIESNDKLLEIVGLNALKYIGGETSIRFNNSLNTIGDFPALEEVNDISIGANPSLENLMGLNALRIINGYLSINNNDALLTLNGLNQLDTVREVVSIGHNDLLENLNGLNALKYIGRSLSIDYNNTLNDVSALENVNHISEGLSFGSNPSLTNLKGVESIPATNGSIFLQNNQQLTDISALADLDPTAITQLIIKNNPALSICEQESICTFLATANDSLITIENNAPICNTAMEISTACTQGSVLEFYCPNDTTIATGIIPDSTMPDLTGFPIVVNEDFLDTTSYSDNSSYSCSNTTGLTFLRKWTLRDIRGKNYTCTQRITIITDLSKIKIPADTVLNYCASNGDIDTVFTGYPSYFGKTLFTDRYRFGLIVIQSDSIISTFQRRRYFQVLNWCNPAVGPINIGYQTIYLRPTAPDYIVPINKEDSIFINYDTLSSINIVRYSYKSECIGSVTQASPTFMDDGFSYNNYHDSKARSDTIELCATGKVIRMVFTAFHLTNGDTLFAYRGDLASLRKEGSPNLLKASGFGVSEAFGGWIDASDKSFQNNSGCLTFIFETNGDEQTGSGWNAFWDCADFTCPPDITVEESLLPESTGYPIFSDQSNLVDTLFYNDANNNPIWGTFGIQPKSSHLAISDCL